MTEQRPGSALQRLRELEAGRAGAASGATQAGATGSAQASVSRGARRGIGGAVAVLALLAWKFKVVLLLVLGKLKFLLAGLKLLKFGKLFSTSWTMVLSMWVYSLYFGAPFAIGFVLLILVHELGHGLAAKWIGLPVSAPIFVPFFGAMIMLKKLPRTTFQDFVIGAGGPLAGTLGGLCCLGVSHAIGGHWGQLLFALAYFTLLINMFNLVPVWQLDGARMAAPFRVSMWALAVVVLAGVTFWIAGLTEELNPISLFIVLAGAYRLGTAWWRERKAARSAAGATPVSALDQLATAQRDAVAERDLDVSDRERWIAWGTYVGLSATLIVLVHHLRLGLPELPA